MQFTNFAFILQVATIAAATSVPLNGASDALLEKRLQEAHADVTQVSYGPICHLHCRREKAAAAAAAEAVAKREPIEPPPRPFAKREPIEVDVQQNNYCLPSNLNCQIRRAAAAAAEKREPKVEVDVQQSNYCLPSNLNCPYKRSAESVDKREPSSDLDARAKITQDEYHYKGGKRESVEKREPKVEVDVTQINYCPDGRVGCHLPRAEPVVEKREPVEVDVQQNNYCLPSNLNCPYKRSVEARDADVYPDTQEAQQ
ncbi:hypothetical protein PG995_007864 [Apiospora arundinis]